MRINCPWHLARKWFFNNSWWHYKIKPIWVCFLLLGKSSCFLVVVVEIVWVKWRQLCWFFIKFQHRHLTQFNHNHLVVIRVLMIMMMMVVSTHSVREYPSTFHPNQLFELNWKSIKQNSRHIGKCAFLS